MKVHRTLPLYTILGSSITLQELPVQNGSAAHLSDERAWRDLHQAFLEVSPKTVQEAMRGFARESFESLWAWIVLALIVNERVDLNEVCQEIRNSTRLQQQEKSKILAVMEGLADPSVPDSPVEPTDLVLGRMVVRANLSAKDQQEIISWLRMARLQWQIARIEDRTRHEGHVEAQEVELGFWRIPRFQMDSKSDYLVNRRLWNLGSRFGAYLFAHPHGEGLCIHAQLLEHASRYFVAARNMGLQPSCGFVFVVESDGIDKMFPVESKVAGFTQGYEARESVTYLSRFRLNTLTEGLLREHPTQGLQGDFSVPLLELRRQLTERLRKHYPDERRTSLYQDVRQLVIIHEGVHQTLRGRIPLALTLLSHHGCHRSVDVNGVETAEEILAELEVLRTVLESECEELLVLFVTQGVQNEAAIFSKKRRMNRLEHLAAFVPLVCARADSREGGLQVDTVRAMRMIADIERSAYGYLESVNKLLRQEWDQNVEVRVAEFRRAHPDASEHDAQFVVYDEAINELMNTEKGQSLREGLFRKDLDTLENELLGIIGFKGETRVQLHDYITEKARTWLTP